MGSSLDGNQQPSGSSAGKASVEHLVASTLGGGDNDENCVACCKTLNRLFGRKSLKVTMQLLLKQRGDFQSPGGVVQNVATPTKAPVTTAPAKRKAAEDYSTPEGQVSLAAEDLRKRGNSRPGNEEKLFNTIRSALFHKGQAEERAAPVLEAFKSRGWVQVNEGKVTYHLHPKA